MTTRLIEECLELERLENDPLIYLIGSYVPNYFLVVDPYMINMKDFENMVPGKIVRLRRPAWGRGNIENYIKRIEFIEGEKNEQTTIRTSKIHLG